MGKSVFFGKQVPIFENTPIVDERGFFKRIFDTNWNDQISTVQLQTSLSNNNSKHTLRGLHFQKGNATENKFVTLLTGCIFDVVVDIRPESETYGDWDAIELHESENKTILVPKGFAHGYLTLTDDVQLIYQMDSPFSSDNYGGIRWDSSQVGIEWPFTPKFISEKDANLEELL